MFQAIETKSKITVMGRAMQYIAMMTGLIFSSITGVTLGWSSPYLPVLQTEHSPVGRITSDEAFWCSIMPFVGAIPGALLAGILVDKVGRMTIMIAITPLCFLCFVAIAFTGDLWVLDLARFIMGSMEGVIFTVLPMYFGEIAEPGLRGALSASIIVGTVFGLLIINVLARYMTICTSALVVSAVPLVHFFVFLWFPKSPYYLIKIGRLEEAKRSLERLRSDAEAKVNEEFFDIVTAVRRQEADVTNASWTDIFTQSGNRRGVYIYLIIVASNKLSGASPLIIYTQSIFHEAGGILDGGTSAILFTFVGLLSAVVAGFMMDKFGRRPLVIISAIGCACSLAVMATYLTLQYVSVHMTGLTWIPIAAMICYYAIFNLGLCLGPVVFLSELFPTSVKGYALGMADSTSVVFSTASAGIFHVMSEYFGMHAAFWVFCAMCICGSLLIYLMVPETKGKTLEQIQMELIGDVGETTTKACDRSKPEQ